MCEILSYLVIQDVIEIWDRNRIVWHCGIGEIFEAYGKPKIYLSVCHFHANTAFWRDILTYVFCSISCCITTIQAEKWRQNQFVSSL